MVRGKKNLTGGRGTALVIMCAVSLSVLVGGYILYQRSIAGVVSSITDSFMGQLADHDIENVSNQVDNQLAQLRFFGKKISLVRDNEQADIPYLLNVDAQAGKFEKLYFITSKGKVYDNSYLTTSLDKVPWADIYREAGSDFVTRYVIEKREAWGEYLLYGTKLKESITYGGEQIEGIAGMVPLEELDGLKNLESFEGRGIMLVMEPNGEIVTASRYYDSGTSLNYFLELKQADKLEDGVTLKQCKKAVSEGKSLNIGYSVDGVRYIAMLKPMGNKSLHNEWYMVVRVPEEVISQRTRIFLNQSLFFFAVLGVILVALTAFVLRIMRTAQVARAAEQAKSAFLANMSHEIRTPLNGITGLLYLMRQNLDDKKKQEEYLEKAEVSADFLKSVITDVLDMSKIESGQMELYSERLNLEKLLREVQMLIGPQAEERKQRFDIVTDMLAAPWVMSDEVRLKQIIVNLLGNALKFTPAGGSITLTVRQELSDNMADTVFEITDTGCGMSSEFLERIWQPFEQERRRGSQNGTGLGTTLSKILAEKMGGTIDVKSRLEQGTTFTVRVPLPVAQGDEADALTEATGLKTLAGMHVLAAEDNDINREILVEILAGYDAGVDTAVNGQEALELFTSREPFFFDVVLMDLQMPVMNGYEAAKAIRTSGRPDAKTTPILALTANAFKEEADRALDCGMDGVVTKPLDVNMLLQKLSALDMKNRLQRNKEADL